MKTPIKKDRRCNACGAKLKKIPRPVKDTADIQRLLRIMKKYKLTQQKVADITLVSPATVNGWLSVKVNPKGTIKKEYFYLLKYRGYK